MTTLTKEHGDQRLDDTKKEIIEKIHELATIITDGSDDIATTKEVVEKIHELAMMNAKGFDDIAKTVRSRRTSR